MQKPVVIALIRLRDRRVLLRFGSGNLEIDVLHGLQKLVAQHLFACIHGQIQLESTCVRNGEPVAEERSEKGVRRQGKGSRGAAVREQGIWGSPG